MDHFDEKLATIIVSPHYSPSIRSAIRFGKKTLNKYYSKTDHSNIYRVAMGPYPYLIIFQSIIHTKLILFSLRSSLQVIILQEIRLGAGVDC